MGPSRPPPPTLVLRPRVDRDMDLLADLWVASWQETMPNIDFAARRDWLVNHIAKLEAEGAITICAVNPPNRIVGFVTLNAATGWLDQLAVAQDAKGTGAAERLIGEAKRLSPGCLALDVNVDNPRALRFYARVGFVTVGEGMNPMSGLKTRRLLWEGAARGPSPA